jgi:hypothetical protein
MKAMPPMGRIPGPDAQIMACMSFADIQAISAKVGEAANPIQLAASRVCRLSARRFLAKMNVIICDLPIEPRRYCFGAASDKDVWPNGRRS